MFVQQKYTPVCRKRWWQLSGSDADALRFFWPRLNVSDKSFTHCGQEQSERADNLLHDNISSIYGDHIALHVDEMYLYLTTVYAGKYLFEQ